MRFPFEVLFKDGVKLIKKESMSDKIKIRQVVQRKVVVGKPACPTNEPPSIIEVNTTLDNHQLAVLWGLTQVDKGSPGRKVWLSIT